MRSFLVLTLALSGCAHAVAPPPEPMAAGAPAAKEIVALVLRNGDVRLDADPSCSGVGTSPGDASIGDFLAGFLAEQTGTGSGKNWIDASCQVGPAKEATPGWECRMLVRRVDGEERWGWGVRFFVRASDRKAVRPSFRCVGAG